MEDDANVVRISYACHERGLLICLSVLARYRVIWLWLYPFADPHPARQRHSHRQSPGTDLSAQTPSLASLAHCALRGKVSSLTCFATALPRGRWPETPPRETDFYHVTR
eukprot:4341043-Prymnesium_polylepis.1